MKSAIGALLMMTAGCAPVEPDAADPGPAATGKCDAAPAQGLIGREASDAIGAEVLGLTGARALRWIPEGAMVTMDYSEQRVNIALDKANKAVRIFCG